MLKTVNSLENNYNAIKLYFRQMEKGLISTEEYAEKKKQLFEDDGWETEYGKLKGKRQKNTSTARTLHFSHCTTLTGL